MQTISSPFCMHAFRCCSPHPQAYHADRAGVDAVRGAGATPHCAGGSGTHSHAAANPDTCSITSSSGTRAAGQQGVMLLGVGAEQLIVILGVTRGLGRSLQPSRISTCGLEGCVWTSSPCIVCHTHVTCLHHADRPHLPSQPEEANAQICTIHAWTHPASLCSLIVHTQCLREVVTSTCNISSAGSESVQRTSAH